MIQRFEFAGLPVLHSLVFEKMERKATKMKYDFTSIMDRHNQDAIAVDYIHVPLADGTAPSIPVSELKLKEGFDLIPMWVADMNFPACPSILEAMQTRISHPAFGYFKPRKEYFDTIIHWHETRNGVTGLKPEHIGYENGVLGGVVSAMQLFCAPGDKVLVHSPTYIGFTNSLSNYGYDIVLSDLKLDDQGVWRMDFADMEEKIANQHIHTMVFCSPHNPTGRVWTKEELDAMAALCEKYDVKVIADEIWSDLIRPENYHIPTQMVNEWMKNNTIAMYAPSKTFNLAGLVGSYHIIYNPTLKDRYAKYASLSHYNSMNVLSMHASIGAYSKEGMEWTDELNQVLAANVDYAYDYITKHFKGVTLSKPEGTYMLFLDCTEWCREHNMPVDELMRKGIEYGVIWQDGRPFHGPYSIRMNVALPTARVKEAFERLDRYVFNVE